MHKIRFTLGLRLKPRAAVGMGIPMGIPMSMGMGGYGDDLPSPQTYGDFKGIFNQPEITR